MRVQETCFLTIHPGLNRIDFEEIADRHDCHPKCGTSAMGRNTASSLPRSFAARGLSRVQAAEYLGVAVTKFDEMVTDGLMPIGGGFTR